MRITKNISPFLIKEDASLAEAMDFMSKNKCSTIFLANKLNQIIASLSDGDLRRYFTSAPHFSISDSCINAANKNFCFHDQDDDPFLINFPNGINILPVLNKQSKRCIAMLQNSNPYLDIGGYKISSESKPFLIAEIGMNHQGSIDIAKKLVDSAKESGADCAKFQLRDISSLYLQSGAEDPSGDLGTQYVLDIIEKYNIKPEGMFEIFDHCKNVGIIPLCTPWDIPSFNLLEEYGLQGYKVASADLTNEPLIEAMVSSNKPLILSTGMSTQQDIQQAIKLLVSNYTDFALLHCNSTYPAPYKDINLNYLKKLKELTNNSVVIGYSGHERGWFMAIAALAMGASIIEKHFTFDKKQEGNDHKVSLLPEELKDLSEALSNAHIALGSSFSRGLSQGEMINRHTLAKSIIARHEIKKDHIINASDIEISSPGNGLQPNQLKSLLGKKAIRNLSKGDVFFESDLNEHKSFKNRFTFSRPYGIPVRPHDFKKLTDSHKFDFIEFHMSWRDLTIDCNEYCKEKYTFDFAVHAPDIFEKDHRIDLGSFDNDHRNQSIQYLQWVVDKTRELKEYFPNTKLPVVVLNVGGWSQDNFYNDDERMQASSLIKESLDKIDFEGVIPAIQTMPPFPWHFGGQGYCNFFILSSEINKFCSDSKYKVCLDISHMLMSANYFNFSIEEYIKNISKFVVHLHISDALGSDGEGVKFGDGDLDIDLIATLLETYIKKIQFLPEIWQGHHDNGRGFFDALEILEKRFDIK